VKREEKKIVEEAVKDFFVKNYVKVKGISTTLKILLNPEDYGMVKDIVSNSIIKGKMSKEEKKILEDKLIELKPEVRKRMVEDITTGEKLFLEMLYNEMEKNDPGEFEKLSNILEGLK